MANPETLKAKREKVEAETIRYIDEELALLRKTKAKYDYVSHLAKYLSERISEKRGKSIAYTTFTRNLVYKKKLMQFMGSSDKNKNGSALEVKKLEEHLFDAKLRIGNLQAENARLRNYIAALDDGSVSARIAIENPNKKGDDYENIAKNLALIISAIKKHFGEEVEWDESQNKIIEAGVDRLIIEGEPVRIFNEWMRNAKNIRGEP